MHWSKLYEQSGVQSFPSFGQKWSFCASPMRRNEKIASEKTNLIKISEFLGESMTLSLSQSNNSFFLFCMHQKDDLDVPLCKGLEYENVMEK